MAGIDVRADPTVDTNLDNYVEGRHSRSKRLGFADSGNGSVTVSQTADIANWFGVGSAIERADLTAQYNGNPTENLYAHVFVAPVYSSDQNAVAVRVTLDLTAILYDAKDPSTS
jgi:hypothetical protein